MFEDTYERPKRPVSIWISQIILAITILVIGGMSVMMLTSPLENWKKVMMLLFMALYLAYFGVTFWALATRRGFGRWMMAVFLGLTIANSVLSLFTDPNMAGNVPGGYKIGYVFGQMLFLGPLSLLVFFLIKSPNVQEFFAKPEIEIPEPPSIEEYARDFGTGGNQE